MTRIWMAIVALCCVGCSGNSERLGNLEKQHAELQKKVDLHDEALVVHQGIIRRMQDQERAKIDEESRIVNQKLREVEAENRRLENN